MQEFLEAITLGEVGVIVVIVGTIYGILRKIVPTIRKGARLIDDVMGAPGHPGVMDRLAAVETKVNQVADTTAATVVQVHPNGGSSMRDQVDNLTRSLAALTALVEERLPEERSS